MAVWPLGGLFSAPIAQSGPFWAQKRSFLARNQFFVHILQFLRYHNDQTPKRQRFRVAHVAEQAPGALQETIFGPKIAPKTDFLRYTPVTHLSWAQAEPTQWDHNIPISWGNFGYLRFSGRCPFYCSAVRFMALIAQNGLFGDHKCRFGPKIYFWRLPPNFVS